MAGTGGRVQPWITILMLRRRAPAKRRRSPLESLLTGFGIDSERASDAAVALSDSSVSTKDQLVAYMSGNPVRVRRSGAAARAPTARARSQKVLEELGLTAEDTAKVLKGLPEIAPEKAGAQEESKSGSGSKQQRLLSDMFGAKAGGSSGAAEVAEEKADGVPADELEARWEKKHGGALLVMNEHLPGAPWPSLATSSRVSHEMAAAGAEKVAAFDMDTTLVVPASGRAFPTNRADWRWMFPGVPAKLRGLHAAGFKIVVRVAPSVGGGASAPTRSALRSSPTSWESRRASRRRQTSPERSAISAATPGSRCRRWCRRERATSASRLLAWYGTLRPPPASAA